MEIYYCNAIKRKTGRVAAWSQAPGYTPLLAVALSPNAVGFYTEEGRPWDPNKEASVLNVRSTECAKMAWHPLLPLLAIGWKDGGISFWNMEERRLEEDSKTHRRPITHMMWSANGERLITTDENGKLAMWKTDRHMRPLHVNSYEEAPGSTICVATMGPSPVSEASNAASCVVFYGVNVQDTTVLKWANDQGQQGVVEEMPECATDLIYYAAKDQLVVVGVSCTLYLLGRVDADSPWYLVTEMRFSSGTGDTALHLQVCWAAEHTLATASGKDSVVRMYNFETEDNYILQVEAADGTPSTSPIVCLRSDARYGMLAAGSADGRVSVFNHNTHEHSAATDLSKAWDAQPAFLVEGPPTIMQWGPNPHLMCVVCERPEVPGHTAVNVCRKKLLHQCCRDGYVVIQCAVDQVLVEQLDAPTPRPPAKLKLDLQLLGLDMSNGSLLVYDGNAASLYEVSEAGDLRQASSFETASRAMAISNDTIFRATENGIECCNTAGIVKQTLAMPGANGGPALLSCNGDFLAAVTEDHRVHVFKVAGREAKPHMGPGLLFKTPAAQGAMKVDMLGVNSSGTMVAVLCSSKERTREPCLHVLCFDNNETLTYDFSKDERAPRSIAWDIIEDKVLGVQTLSVQRGDDLLSEEQVANEVALVFVSPEHGVLLQEYQSIDAAGAKGLVAIQAPHLILNKPSAHAVCAAKVPMQGFAGMQDGDDEIKSKLLDFSYFLATNNKDEAFRVMKTIKKPAIFENMVHLCIKNKRLDVAEHCLGSMEHVRGAQAVREAKSIEDLDARVATVAVHLGMMDDARKLYASAERYDLLCRLYQASGQWDKALEVAEKHDRIHLKTTHYAHAQFLEKAGDFEAAKEAYTKSGCGPVEITRMYFQAGRSTELEEYIASQDNKELSTWWGRYCESHGDIKQALACYKRVNDVLSIVRVHCYTRNFEEAEEQVAAAGADPAAAFHLARQFEAQNRIAEAIQYYTKAKRYSHGVRLAKAYELDEELMNLALKSTPAVMVSAAEYLDEKGAHEKAATLYMKGGKLGKAVDMCFAAQLFDVLGQIADDLSSGGDPVLYMRCAEFFMQNGHYDKAVRMTVAAGRHTQALEMAMQHEVPIDEEMAEAMTPAKGSMPDAQRNVVLQQIAKVAKRQGAWQLAAKKFTQAGEKVKAMKALLRSGDREKIVFFTGVSRNKEVYLMAANYLQTLDWHSNPEIMKNIITFYTKAQAMDSLALFYESCAQIEVDEYRDYDKALQALHEALKHLKKSSSEDAQFKASQIQNQITTTENFVTARAMIISQPQQALQMCEQLLMSITDDAQSGIRVGDVFALMVEYWYEQQNGIEAYKLIEQMRTRGVVIAPYLDHHMVEDIHRMVGIPMPEEASQVAAAPDSPAYGAQMAQQYTAQEGYVEDEEIDEEV